MKGRRDAMSWIPRNYMLYLLRVCCNKNRNWYGRPYDSTFYQRRERRRVLWRKIFFSPPPLIPVDFNQEDVVKVINKRSDAKQWSFEIGRRGRLLAFQHLCYCLTTRGNFPTLILRMKKCKTNRRFRTILEHRFENSTSNLFHKSVSTMLIEDSLLCPCFRWWLD